MIETSGVIEKEQGNGFYLVKNGFKERKPLTYARRDRCRRITQLLGLCWGWLLVLVYPVIVS